MLIPGKLYRCIERIAFDAKNGHLASPYKSDRTYIASNTNDIFLLVDVTEQLTNSYKITLSPRIKTLYNNKILFRVCNPYIFESWISKVE